MDSTPEKTEKKANPGVYEHTFREPFEYEGQKYTKTIFNFGKLTGKDYLAIENEMLDNNEFMITSESSRGFLYRLAGKAAGIGSDVLVAMPISDFNKIVNAARRFLLSTE
ncbi:MAG: phage tail assembly protein [Oscillospiraceae bacterium]|nr:phage tail assembly protein [Oscillospiraceae bacterium]